MRETIFAGVRFSPEAACFVHKISQWTFAKLRGVEMVALAEAFQVANVHISSLLGVFLTPELNPVWNDRLIEQRLLYIDGRRHAYQVYQLP